LVADGPQLGRVWLRSLSSVFEVVILAFNAPLYRGESPIKFMYRGDGTLVGRFMGAKETV
jgi:hypothetical protein